MNIPIKALKEISQKYGYDHIICFATKGKMQHVATYGNTIQACDEAAQFGDKLKDGLGWPESLHAAPSRVRALQKRVKELEAQLAAASQIEFDEEIKWILGRPNFACAGVAHVLRESGQKIAKKAEDEQASVIYWMLSLYQEHGKDWRKAADDFIKKGSTLEQN